jgi:PAS domain S-box-containing protein
VNRIEQAVSNFRSQQRLELTRRRFKTLVEESNDAILVVDATGTIHYATSATNHILGKSPEELVGTDGFEPIHTEDVTAVIEELEKLIENPEHRAQVEFRYQHADRSWIWVEVRGRNLLQNDEIAGIVVYVRDIDERKTKGVELERKEQTFRAVFDGASDAMVLANDEGVYVDANKAACDFFGLEKDELLGRTIREFAPEDYNFDDTWQQFQQSEYERGLFPLVRPDGDRRIVEFSATRDILPNRHLSILRDITDQNQLTEIEPKN